jgi:SAM-dependent methyltransferase
MHIALRWSRGFMGGAGTRELQGDWARHAFEAMAPFYDDFTAHYQYEFWTARLLDVLAAHGLQGRRLLDVACGTGKSFLPMTARGWEVAGYDVSTSMLERARQKAPESVRLEIADMREEPVLGTFDLVWALDDAVNYLLSGEELRCALSGMRENLAPTGLLLFDVNELAVYRVLRTESIEVDRDGRRLVWRADGEWRAEVGSLCEFSCFEAAAGDPAPEAASRRKLSTHRQRHFPEAEILAAMEAVGLECLAVYGQGTDGVPRQPLDDSTHTKAVYVGRPF